MLSVLMCAYRENPDDFKMAVESILAQTYSDFEFMIILDNPENQELEQIIRFYQEQDDRIRLIKNPRNLGLTRSLNRGLGFAKYEFIARMDSDDIAMPERFERQMALFEKHPSYAMVSANKIDIDENGEVITPNSPLPESYETIKNVMRFQNVIFHPTVMFRKEAVMQLGGYREVTAAEDYDLWLRMLSSGFEIGILNEYLLKYRIRSQSISRSNLMKQYYAAKYCRKLHEMRLRNGKDNYSPENMQSYLETHCASGKQEKYMQGYEMFLKSWDHLGQKQYPKALGEYMKAVILEPEMLFKAYSLMQYKRFMNSEKK